MAPDRHFDVSLQALIQQLTQMGANVEDALDAVTQALITRNVELLKKVHITEDSINRAQIEVDETCVNLIALQQPLAVDLRLIIATLKISTDLERIGDQTVNIAHNSERYLAAPELKPLHDLPRMFAETKEMVRLALSSFIHQDAAVAKEVLTRDDSVDALKAKIFRDVIEIMKQIPEKIDQGISLILIARNLERIGDHATNIAEDVIFAVSGKDIRHPQKRP